MVSLPIDLFWHGAPLPAAAQALVRLSALPDGQLAVEFNAPLHGDPPPSAPAGSTDRLWEHEVIEVFLAGPGVGYIELEFGPYGHFLGLRLRDIRQPERVGLPMRYSVAHRAHGRWDGRAVVAPEYLPPRPWRGNAYVIHAQGCAPAVDGGRCYHAHRPVPGEAPDFHQPSCFTPLDL